MRLGSALHSRILEPHVFEKQYRTGTGINRRLKAVREEIEMLTAQGITVLDENESEQLDGMTAALFSHKLAAKLLAADEGENELSFFWEDECGLGCRCRPDCLRHDGIIVDLKTCQDAGEAFERHAFDMGYHMQAAFYSDGIKANNVNVEAFIFIAVESKPPHDVVVWRAHHEALMLGRMAYKAALDKIFDAKKHDDLPGYSNELKVLCPPRWLLLQRLTSATNR